MVIDFENINNVEPENILIPNENKSLDDIKQELLSNIKTNIVTTL